MRDRDGGAAGSSGSADLQIEVRHAYVMTPLLYEPRLEKTCLQDFRPGPAKIMLYSLR